MEFKQHKCQITRKGKFANKKDKFQKVRFILEFGEIGVMLHYEWKEKIENCCDLYFRGVSTLL
jgi:hypothetical protein